MVHGCKVDTNAVQNMVMYTTKLTSGGPVTTKNVNGIQKAHPMGMISTMKLAVLQTAEIGCSSNIGDSVALVSSFNTVTEKNATLIAKTTFLFGKSARSVIQLVVQ